MSTEPERADIDPEAPTQHESLGGVLGISLGLALVALAVLQLATGHVEALDAEGALRAHFEYEKLPFELEVHDARRLPRGDTIISMRLPGAEQIDPLQELSEARSDGPQAEDGGELSDEGTPQDSRGEPGEGRGGPPEHSFWVDWSKVPVGDEGQAPVAAVLVDYPLSRAEKTLRDEFTTGGSSGRGGRRFRGGGGGGFVGPDGGTSTLDSGRLDWHGLAPAFLHQRHYTKENGAPTFFDRVRVNLSLMGRCRVLYLRWAERAPASRDQLEEALRSLRPLASELEALAAGGG